MTVETKVAASSDVISTELDGEAVLMHVTNGMYFGRNGVGSTVWQLMKAPVTVERLCEAVAREFDVERDVCEGDVLELLAQLEGHGLVRIVATES